MYTKITDYKVYKPFLESQLLIFEFKPFFKFIKNRLKSRFYDYWFGPSYILKYLCGLNLSHKVNLNDKLYNKLIKK